MQRRPRLPLPVLVSLVSLSCLWAAPASAQGSGASSQGEYGNFHFDSLGREEWTRDVPVGDGTTKNESRWSIQLRPNYDITAGPFDFGIGAAINYSQDHNDRPPQGGTLTIIRDNYRSRDFRLDLAYARLRLGPVSAQGGRFLMPLPLTDLVWDHDLRPQGGSASLSLGGASSPQRLTATGLYLRGSHVFEDKSVMWGGGADLTLALAQGSALQIAGSYLVFDRLDRLDPLLARQNAILGGSYRYEYRVADATVRMVSGATMTLVADYCWNTALSSDNRGLWLSATFGALDTTVAQVAYTYARVDREATVAAFSGDDFYWGTAFEGHRVDLGRGTTKNSSVHAVAQWQRPRGDISETGGRWVLRWRLEWRSDF